jgi:hypothetical protein
MRCMKNQIFNVCIFILWIFSCYSPYADLADQYPVVYNTHNVNKIVILYTDDAVFQLFGQFYLIGKDQIKNFTEYDSVLNINIFINM